ncbi:putative Ig domain-containing protein, partial [Pseudoalteromonas sp. SMS1]|uniref:putative Ig domain-containing protein n=1 Tax=Pseudoalteromonas sp. SMS1 TaxID=2908894 RepID=UPI001F2EA09F
IDANTGVISGDVHYNAKAQHTVKITVVNVHDTGFSAQATMRINVTDIDPVTVANVPMILREEYYEVAPDAFKKYVAISDTSLNVRYSISGSSGIPDGLHFDSNTGLFSGQLTSEAAGDYPLTITLSDPSKGFEKQVDIHARIIDVPSVTVKADSGKKVFGPEQWFDGGYDSFGMEVPTGGAASWITLSKHNNMGLQTLTIEPPRDAHRQTPYVFVLFANDPHGNRIPDKYVKVQVRVSAPDPIVPQNRAPALNSTVSLTVNGKAKEPVRHVISATAFVDPDGDTITYSMSGLPSGLFFNASTREITGAVNIAGSYTAKLRATDSQGAWREANVTMNIAAVGNTNSKPKYNENRSLHLSLIAGQRGGVTIQPDTFTDPDGDTITYSMSGLPRGLSFNASTRRLEGMVTNAGDYSATLYATDSHNAQSSKTFYIYVDAASGGGGGIPMGATPVNTVSTATNTEHFNALDGASAQSMSSQAVSPTSTGVTRTEDYWFTYNGNNQVVIDGGSFIGDKISIADQG